MVQRTTDVGNNLSNGRKNGHLRAQPPLLDPSLSSSYRIHEAEPVRVAQHL